MPQGSPAANMANRKAMAPGTGLDYCGIGVEISKYAEKGQKIDWQAIANKCGSASGASVCSNWNKFKRNYVLVPIDKSLAHAGRAKKAKSATGEDSALKPKISKVSKNSPKKRTPKSAHLTEASEEEGQKESEGDSVDEEFQAMVKSDSKDNSKAIKNEE